MLRVDFAFDAHDRVAQAVRTTLRQVGRGTPIMVFCDDKARLDRYAQQLWAQQEDTGFMAHERLTPEATEGLSVYLIDTSLWPLLASKLTTEPYQQSWLLNLDDAPPPEAGIFQRVLEIVSQEPEEREYARERWRFYQELGAQIHSHRLAS
ncbi:MAG: DNA polymerase III subunit chi [Orrella sp.]